MVKPSSRLGQRRNAISLRMSRGRLGSISTESAAIAAIPAAATLLMNLRRLIAGKTNLSRAYDTGIRCKPVAHFQHNARPKNRVIVADVRR